MEKVESHQDLRRVKLGILLVESSHSAQPSENLASRNVLHDVVKLLVGLECVLEMNDERMVEAGHDVTLVLSIFDVFRFFLQSVLPDCLEGINPARVVLRGLADFLDSVDVPIHAKSDLTQDGELSAQ